MRSTKLLSAFIFTLAFAAMGFSQSTLAGRVVQVLDGKTVVIQISSGTLTAELQYIDVPEPEQPLHGMVRQHLEKLVMDKEVTFKTSGFGSAKTFGQLFVNSSDIAIQMLRDGAAWHVSPEKSGQKASEGDAYEYHQTQAKLENRGVWGVKDLKPAWQFRAEKQEQIRQAQVAKESVNAGSSEARFETASSTTARKPVRREGPWADVNPLMKDPGPLLHGYNAAGKTGWLSTPLMGVKELEGVPVDQKVACEVTYVYKQESEKLRKGKFVFTLISVADEWRFIKENSVSVLVDEKNVFTGKPKRTTTKEEGKAVEKLTYEISKAAIEKVVYGGEVTLKIGKYNLYPGQGMQLLLYNMLQVAE